MTSRSGLADREREARELANKLPDSFSNSLIMLRNEMSMSQADLAGDIGVSNRTISNWEQNHSKLKSIEKLVAICLALKLHPVVSRALFLRAKLQLGYGKEEDVYRAILRKYWDEPYDVINRILIENNVKELLEEK